MRTAACSLILQQLESSSFRVNRRLRASCVIVALHMCISTSSHTWLLHVAHCRVQFIIIIATHICIASHSGRVVAAPHDNHDWSILHDEVHVGSSFVIINVRSWVNVPFSGIFMRNRHDAVESSRHHKSDIRNRIFDRAISALGFT